MADSRLFSKRACRSVMKVWPTFRRTATLRSRAATMSFSGQAAVEVVLNDMKDKLRSKLGSVMAMFHSMDKDNSQNLSAEEFKRASRSLAS